MSSFLLTKIDTGIWLCRTNDIYRGFVRSASFTAELPLFFSMEVNISKIGGHGFSTSSIRVEALLSRATSVWARQKNQRGISKLTTADLSVPLLASADASY